MSLTGSVSSLATWPGADGSVGVLYVETTVPPLSNCLNDVEWLGGLRDRDGVIVNSPANSAYMESCQQILQNQHVPPVP
jgi:hypothetical protein